MVLICVNMLWSEVLRIRNLRVCLGYNWVEKRDDDIVNSFSSGLMLEVLMNDVDVKSGCLIL